MPFQLRSRTPQEITTQSKTRPAEQEPAATTRPNSLSLAEGRAPHANSMLPTRQPSFVHLSDNYYGPAHTLPARHSLCFRAVRRPAVGRSGSRVRMGVSACKLYISPAPSVLFNLFLTVYYIVRTQKGFLTVCLYEVMNLLISFFLEAPVHPPLVSPNAGL